MPTGSAMVFIGLLAASLLPAATEHSYLSVVQIHAQVLKGPKKD